MRASGYYIEVLHKAGVGTNDNWAVGWLQDPTGTNTTPAGVVPGYLLSRHFPLPPAYVPGTLYAANMLAYAGAVSSGVGSATLRLSADETQAILSYHYSGLSSPVTAKHVHADQYLNFPSQIIFDIDAATPQPDGSYVWTIAPASPLSSSDIIEIIKEGKAYINVHTANYGGGEIRGNFTLANGSQNFTPPPAPLLWRMTMLITMRPRVFSSKPASVRARAKSQPYSRWVMTRGSTINSASGFSPSHQPLRHH